MRKKLPKILITGGAGFIGSEFVRQTVKEAFRIAVVDKLTYAGDPARLAQVKNRISFYRADIADKPALERIFRQERPDIVVNFAAESHVDRSILDGSAFLESNIKGTQVLMDVARQRGIEKFVHISTDEVYGDIPKGKFTESSPLAPSSPYSASKAAADMLVLAYLRTYAFPAVIVRPSNNYGPWQYPEKFIPVVIARARCRQKVPVYAKGLNQREWLHVWDCVRGVFTVMNKGKIGQIYNLGGGIERKNIELAKAILKILNKSQDLIVMVADRPGHDFRYRMDSSKIEKLGWKPQVKFETGLRRTVSWYLDHASWINEKTRTLSDYWRRVYKP